MGKKLNVRDINYWAQITEWDMLRQAGRGQKTGFYFSFIQATKCPWETSSSCGVCSLHPSMHSRQRG